MGETMAVNTTGTRGVHHFRPDISATLRDEPDKEHHDSLKTNDMRNETNTPQPIEGLIPRCRNRDPGGPLRKTERSRSTLADPNARGATIRNGRQNCYCIISIRTKFKETTRVCLLHTTSNFVFDSRSDRHSSSSSCAPPRTNTEALITDGVIVKTDALEVHAWQ